MDSDVIVLVTEPTPFGLYDLGLAREAFAEMGKPMGVVVNRAGIGDRSLYDYCREHRLDILAEIPYNREIAEAYSKGRIISEIDLTYRSLFQDLARRIQTMNTISEKEPEAAYD
jgi:MinD superfamily P-loop ATPase